jgi:hypothetical protein
MECERKTAISTQRNYKPVVDLVPVKLVMRQSVGYRNTAPEQYLHGLK